MVDLKIINDEVFGEYALKQYDLDDTCNFDKNKFICNMPFHNAEIKGNGDVYVCCPEWNPMIIGNLLKDDLKTIWTGEKANAIRQSMWDKSFKYCNHRTCPAMLAGHAPYIIDRKVFKDPQSNYPFRMSFSIDNTCNLECPSCRVSKILTSTSSFQKSALRVMKNIFDVIFEKPHTDEVFLTMDGAGEIFHSSVYRQLFENTPEFRDLENWPNVKFVLCTNGTMMTPKIQNKYDYILDRSSDFRFSIDAGNEESYKIVRKGGDWNMLWDNINYLYENRISKMRQGCWSFNLILQKDNYESLPELVAIANSYEVKPEIYITNILQWDERIISNERFAQVAVWQKNHPEHENMKKILNLPEVKNYWNILKPF